MSSTRLTLAQQLAQLDDPTPIDIDPEDEDFAGKHGDDDPNGPEEHSTVNGRAHYLNVEPSKLRKPHESLNEPKYAGKKITRQLGDNISSAEEDDKHISEDDSESSTPAEEEEEPSHSDSDSEMEPNGPNHTEDLSNVLKRAKESDRAKGRAVSKQLAIWDTLLDSRIRLQKASALCNTLPTSYILSDITSQEGAKRSAIAFLEEVILLSNDLFELREVLLAASTTLTDIVPPPHKKRRIETPSPSNGLRSFPPAITSASHHFAEMGHDYHPHLLTTLQKWSSKIQAVTPSNLLPSSRNAFRTNKSQSKPVTQLIEESLADNSKLVSRTRIRRGDPRIDQVADGAYSNVDVEGKPLLNEENDIFDDADFYQQLLRDIIEGQGENGYDADELEARKRKVKKQIDTRASKGRKLRYEVHEKMANFMVPVPTIAEGWHEEKIDELFASLLGKRAESLEEGTFPTDTLSAAQDGFRIFG